MTQGQVFAGDFRIVEPLSVGGMGAVFIAEQLSTGKRRALKVMHAHIEAYPKLRERFAVEARVGSLVQSEHVVEVVGAGVDADTGSPWLAMELLDGSDLEQFLQERGPLSLEAGRNVLRQVGHALAAAHAAKIVHRDLKPANVFLARSQRADVPYTVKLLDFGIVKVLSDLTQTGTGAIGTPLYMAPEQVTGKGVGPRTDVWAYGLLAFALWVGRTYWLEDRDPVQLFRELDRGATETASARVSRLGLSTRLPGGFDDWFARCVAVDPHARFADAGEASRALEALDFNEPPAVVDVTADAHLQRVADTLPGSALATAPARAPRRRAPTPSPRWEPVPSIRATSPFPVHGSGARAGAGYPLTPAARRKRSLLIGLTVASACLLLLAVVYVLLDPISQGEATPPTAQPTGGVTERAETKAPPPRATNAPLSKPNSTPGPARCDPPYYMDKNGIKKFKPECL